MLPFPIINKTPKVHEIEVLNIDFSRQAIGDTNVIDLYGHTFSKVGTGLAQVQNDTIGSKGNVMVFSGSSYFSTPMVNDLKLSNKNFEIRTVFRVQGTTEQMVFATGDYYSAGALVGGMLLTIFNNTGSQLFCTDSTGTFTRCYFGYTVNIWRDISFKWDFSSRIMQIYDNDTNQVLQTYTVPAGFGDGTQFSIAGSYVRGNVANLNGAIKSIKVLVSV